jgi:hypothetical protein
MQVLRGEHGQEQQGTRAEERRHGRVGTPCVKHHAPGHHRERRVGGTRGQSQQGAQRPHVAVTNGDQEQRTAPDRQRSRDAPGAAGTLPEKHPQQTGEDGCRADGDERAHRDSVQGDRREETELVGGHRHSTHQRGEADIGIQAARQRGSGRGRQTDEEDATHDDAQRPHSQRGCAFRSQRACRTGGAEQHRGEQEERHGPGGSAWGPQAAERPSSVLIQKFVEQIVAGSRRLPVRAPRRRKGWN